MNPQQLHKPNGTPAGVYYCSECGRISHRRDAVEWCCLCQICGQFVGNNACGTYGGGFSRYHESCWRERSDRIMQGRLDEAELVAGYEGPWYSPEGYGRDGFIFDDVEEVLVESVESIEDWPEYLFCCKPIPVELDANTIVESALDDMPEEVADAVSIPKLFVEGVEMSNRSNQSLVAYDPDYSRKVKVPPPADLFDNLVTECVCDPILLANTGCKCGRR